MTDTPTAHSERGDRDSRLNLSVVILIAGAFLLRLVIAWAPLEWLLRTVLADDSFYYFTIARNAVHGHGFSFDTLSETNGFHPLWMGILLPVHLLTEDRVLAIHATLTLNALIEVGSLLLLWNLLSELGTSHFVKTTILAVYGLAPVVFSYAGPMNGMETALNVFLTLAYMRQLWKTMLQPVADYRSSISLGILAGLLLLARTDNLVLVATSCLFLPIIRISDRGYRGRVLFTITLATIIVTLPWLLWSLLKFGTIVQVSGVSVPYMIKWELHRFHGWSTVNDVMQIVKNLVNTATFFPFYLHETRILSIPAMVVTIAAIALLQSLARIVRQPSTDETKMKTRFVLIMFGSAVAFVVVHTLRAVYMRGWYYMSLTPLLLVSTAILLDFAARRHFSLKTRMVALSGLGVLYLVSLSTVSETRHGEIDKFRMATAMNLLLRDGARVGSGNAGLYGYFFERGIVLGLDGLVNNEAYERIRRNDLEEYCRQNGITHLVDPLAAFERTAWFWNSDQASPLSSLEIIHREPGQTTLDTIGLGRLRY
jgi:hypothetical protein